MIVEQIAPLLKTLTASRDAKLVYVTQLMTEADRLAKLANPSRPVLTDAILVQAIKNYVPKLQSVIAGLQSKSKSVVTENAALALIQKLLPTMASDAMITKAAGDIAAVLKKTIKGLNAKTGTDLVLAALDKQFGIMLDKTRALVIIKQILG